MAARRLFWSAQVSAELRVHFRHLVIGGPQPRLPEDEELTYSLRTQALGRCAGDMPV